MELRLEIFYLFRSKNENLISLLNLVEVRELQISFT